MWSKRLRYGFWIAELLVNRCLILCEIHVMSATDYNKSNEIYSFVESALSVDSKIASFLKNDNPARHVVVKPNWVQEAHEHKPDIWEPLITHPSIVIAVVETLAKKMRGRGTISICDAPHTYASFEAIVARGELKSNLEKIRLLWPELQLELLDLRRETWITKEEVVVERHPNPDDPRGYVMVDLGGNSLFYRHPGEGRFYGADYDRAEVNKHHCGEKQEYLIAGTPIACDLFINLPKMKTHKKTGITCCLKNLVGINGNKNWLPHHTEGGPSNLGDEFPQLSLKNRLESGAKKFGTMVALNVPILGTWAYRKVRNTGKQVFGNSEAVIRNGNWSGNDTCWRMALDLNRALLYANSDGTWREHFQPKAYLAIVDGIVGGEGNGPLCPDAVQSNILVSGTNAAEVDAVVAKLMGFDPYKIPIIKHAFEFHRFPISTNKIENLMVFDKRLEREIILANLAPAMKRSFRPHFGWPDILDEKTIYGI